MQVRGASRLEADIQFAPTEAIVRGSLQDEIGEPLAAFRVRFELTPNPQSDAEASTLRVGSCQTFGIGALRETGFVDTGSDGQFCARLARNQLPENATLRITLDDSPNYVGTVKTIALDDLRAALKLELTPSQSSVDLDRPEWSLVALLHPLAPENLRDSPPLPVELSLLSLENGKAEQRALQRVQMRVGAPTSISIATKSLGRPGSAELRFSFDGNPIYRPFKIDSPIERMASVRLEAKDWPERTIAGDRLTSHVRADSIVGAPATGFVEVIAFGGTPRLFPLTPDGNARITIPTPRHTGRREVTLRFQASTRGWIGTPALHLPVELIPPSKWIPAGWAALAFVVFGWFAWSRRRDDATPATQNPQVSPKPYAHLELLEAAADGESGWSGFIVDAHDGVSINGASIELRLPGFGREELLFSTSSDASGQFAIPAQVTDKPGTYRLEIRAQGYAKLGLQLPSPGRVKVFLVSVRRAILDRFVSWTRRRGHPYDAKVEPTPDWVANVAKTKGQHEVENWAKSVAVAAFGQHSPPDAEAPELVPPAGGIGAPAGVKRNDSLSNG